MNIIYEDKSKGIIASIEANGIKVPFYEGLGPGFYIKENGEKKRIELTEKDGAYTADFNGVEFSLIHEVSEDSLNLKAKIRNTTDSEFKPEVIGLCLGINSYMIEYPQWNDKFFPTYLRTEKTHFTGYFMSPLGKLAAVVCDSPAAAWELDYNMTRDEIGRIDFGHRIYTGNLLLTADAELPARYPQDLKAVGAHEEKNWNINILPLDNEEQFRTLLADRFNIPSLKFDRYTYAKGETAELSVLCRESYTVKVESPCGKMTDNGRITLDEYGVYTVTVTTESGKISEAKIYCRHDYGWYLKAARKNAVYKPQKASTHTESWYGHFSSFLAQKHYPDARLDALAKANFDEIMPLMYDFAKGEALIIPKRIQNTALLISLLTDLYEADKENNEKYLDYANNMAEDLIGRQSESGAYLSGTAHYTSVIYIAKSMLELAFCEKELAGSDPKYLERHKRHYASAKKAVYDLKTLGERIGTEGEHTLEDGMITCSALQLGYYALTLKEDERQEFIDVAEHLMNVHRCLEDNATPDCRTNGGTLRFWEAQYDVMYRGNMLNTPHGWTSWKIYATYYLYLLTGNEEYLRDTVNTMGACLQMIDENENLRWAFIKDPYLNLNVFVPDTSKPVQDGYKSVPEDIEPAYRGRHVKKCFGEEYVDTISGWYRVAEQKITGGYQLCPLIYDDHIEEVDNQGGACDNDVHEHFKCLEETLLKKVFVIVKDGAVRGYNCSAELKDGMVAVTPYGECEYIHVNADSDLTVKLGDTEIQAKKGMQMIKL